MNEREIIKEIQSYIKLKIFDRIRTKGKKAKRGNILKSDRWNIIETKDSMKWKLMKRKDFK